MKGERCILMLSISKHQAPVKELVCKEIENRLHNSPFQTKDFYFVGESYTHFIFWSMILLVVDAVLFLWWKRRLFKDQVFHIFQEKGEFLIFFILTFCFFKLFNPLRICFLLCHWFAITRVKPEPLGDDTEEFSPC